MSEVNSKNITTGATTQTNQSVVSSNNSTLPYNDDSGTSNSLASSKPDPSTIKGFALDGSTNDPFRSVSHSAGLFKRSEIDYFTKRYRFGILDPYSQLNSCREYLFFTKPDLNIFPRSDSNSSGTPANTLQTYLGNSPFWSEMQDKYYPVLECLQQSLSPKDRFNHLLENTVQSNLEVPSMSSEMIDTATNLYGVGYQYRGSSEASDDTFDFSLEFRDTKYLPVYHFFRAYEDYETIKHHGQIRPWIQYIKDKILYDQFAIYKFLVDLDDGETILYYAKYYGVKSKSLPRDVFSNTDFSNGLSYSIDFNAAFFEDMNPLILNEFNNLSREYYNSMPYQVDVHNSVLDRIDNRAAKAAYIMGQNSSNASRRLYKLKWRGDERF